jgi:hypothetical protein
MVDGLALHGIEVGGDRDHRVHHLLAEVGLRGLLHLDQDHRRDLVGRKGPRGAPVLALDVGLSVLGNDLEGEVLHVRLQRGVVHLCDFVTVKFVVT